MKELYKKYIIPLGIFQFCFWTMEKCGMEGKWGEKEKEEKTKKKGEEEEKIAVVWKRK